MNEDSQLRIDRAMYGVAFVDSDGSRVDPAPVLQALKEAGPDKPPPDVHLASEALRARFTSGGKVGPRGVPTMLAPGENILTPERAEEVGLTADAKAPVYFYGPVIKPPPVLCLKVHRRNPAWRRLSLRRM